MRIEENRQLLEKGAHLKTPRALKKPCKVHVQRGFGPSTLWLAKRLLDQIAQIPSSLEVPGGLLPPLPGMSSLSLGPPKGEKGPWFPLRHRTVVGEAGHVKLLLGPTATLHPLRATHPEAAAASSVRRALADESAPYHAARRGKSTPKSGGQTPPEHPPHYDRSSTALLLQVEQVLLVDCLHPEYFYHALANCCWVSADLV